MPPAPAVQSTGETCLTSRVTAPGAERHLDQPIPVLDHGFVRLVDYMGDDAAVCQAARVSYGKGTKTSRDDEGLIRYLLRHHHMTPFEMCEIKLHVKLPIFVARQWIRHRTASVNEMSARYSVFEQEFHIPEAAALARQSSTNRQGRASESLPGDTAEHIRNALREDCDLAWQRYEETTGQGLSREIARINLPVNIYTQWYWKTDLRNLMHFIELRAARNAQAEIQEYARAVATIAADWVPWTFRAFKDYRINATSLSAVGRRVIRRMLAGEQVTQADSGMSPGEWREFCLHLGHEDP